MPAIRLHSVSPLAADIPHVWQGHEMACAESKVVPTGFAELDAELPGGGWPIGLVEVLQERPEQHVWQLTSPALSSLFVSEVGPTVLVSPPFDPFLPSLEAQGVAGSRLLSIRAARPAARLWAAEQALRCAEVTAVLAWLPQSRSSELRRLQISASQHSKLLFVFRTLSSLQDASPARVRIQVCGTEAIELRILKRRGPPLQRAVILPGIPPRLEALLQARRRRSTLVPAIQLPTQLSAAEAGRRVHVLDRIAAPG